MKKPGSLEDRYAKLESRKGSLHIRCEKYARHTLPYLFPKEGQEQTELDADLDSIGARAVNHLSNKLVSTLFPAYRPFVRLEIADEARLALEKKQVPIDKVNEALAKGEKKVVRTLDQMGHRTAATEACKLLIVTGNALMYYPDKGKAQVYSVRDYCVMRDLSGNVIEIMTRDMKAFETFTEEVQEQLRTTQKEKKYDDNTDVVLYTQILLNKNGKYIVRQAADCINLTINDNQYAPKDLPWRPLTWNLSRGEDYGRGHVEDYRGAFGAIEVLTRALIDGIIIAAEIKFLVNPGSVVDVAEMNKAATGSYHSGRDGDIVTIKCDKAMDFASVRQVLEDYTRQIAQAFLLNSAVTRDAERVTAEEIRYQAQELETAYGGVYSRFTKDWQDPLARLILTRVDIQIGDDTIFPVIVTGLDTLSRLGDIDNYRMMMEDLSAVAALPEVIQQYLDVPKLIAFTGTNRGLDYAQFMKKPEQVQAENEAMQEQAAEMQAGETGGKMLEAGTKELMKQDI